MEAAFICELLYVIASGGLEFPLTKIDVSTLSGMATVNRNKKIIHISYNYIYIYRKWLSRALSCSNAKMPDAKAAA